ncbi:type II toxin-antitoxin system YafO family toxin [Pseudomonas sp. GD03860]|uniref:type II toxin-antitoxin system YafO family toxin n=1 Tax=Pseudomonas sp. GD03860 TaxID=2975389 RepID=UPI00244AD338|nr:type II toxin-antitoxin system YafO family toxin [Pseudomonas sp. GD03860]MDH0638223.1 type II toxin-antitoxin system YafO family toxin [Pseudomonas sp. GD03860]
MPIEIVFHPGTFEEFFRPIDQKHAGLSSTLQSEFERYIASGRNEIPVIFGRDAPYTQPSQALDACLMHIHVRIPPAKFRLNTPQRDRVCRKGRPGEDAALVYVQGELYEHRYLILAFLWPDAHGKSRDRDVMKYLCRMALEWRSRN